MGVPTDVLLCMFLFSEIYYASTYECFNFIFMCNVYANRYIYQCHVFVFAFFPGYSNLENWVTGSIPIKIRPYSDIRSQKET